MILDKQEILNYLREISPELEAEGFYNLCLFGSYAKDMATDESDIDICYVVSEEYIQKYSCQKYLQELDKIEKKISAIFYGKKVDLVDISDMNEFMVKAVEQSVIYADKPRSEIDKPHIPDDIFIVENILQEFEELETIYYNTDNLICHYNKDNPFDDFRIRRAVQSCIDTSFRRILRLIRHNSFAVEALTEEERKEIQETKEALSYKHNIFDEPKATQCVKEFIPVLKAKFEALLAQYNEKHENTSCSPGF